MKEFENDVLFQKIGNIWYVFTEKENEVFYSALPKGLDPHKADMEFYQVIEEHIGNNMSKIDDDLDLAS